jgi:TraG P-loop domain
MVALTSLKKQKNAGNILNLINVREIQDSCLCSQAPKKKEQEYRAVLAIEPVNFGLMSDREQETVLESFRILLQRLSIGNTLSIHIRIRPYDLQPYLEKLQYARESTDNVVIRDIAQDHELFVRGLTSEQAILQREFYIRVVAPQLGHTKKRLSPEELFDRAKNQLDLLCRDVLEDIQRCGLAGHRLDNIELAQYYLSCVHSHYAEQFPIQAANLLAVDTPLQAARFKNLRETLQQENTAPAEPMARKQPQETAFEQTPSMDIPLQEAPEKPLQKKRKGKNDKEDTPYTTLVDLLQPAMIEQREHYIKVHRESSEYFRGRSIEGYPAIVIAGWLDRLIQINEPYVDMLLFLETLDPKSYTNNLTRQITGYRATQVIDDRHGKTENPYIAAARENVEELRDKLVRQTEHVHAVSLYLFTRGSSLQELKQRDEKLVSLLRSLDLDSVELSLEHLQAWEMMLPDSKDILARRKILDTSSVVTAFPFASSSLSTEPGSLVGVMPNGSLVIVNPASPQLENGHEIKFARSGAGKSFDAKVRLARDLLMGFEGIVIDPEDEFYALCKEFNGVTIRLSSGTLPLNPFDLPRSDTRERTILEEQFQSLLTLFDLLLADKDPGTLSQREKSYLQKCIAFTYAKKGITSDVTTHRKKPPCMYDLYSVLDNDEECGPDTFELADRLSRHLFAFPEETSVELSNPLIVFSIRDLSDELKPAGLFLITDFVWKRVRSEKFPRPRLLVIDEAWTLLEFPEGGRFLASLSRRARKYNLCLRVISQNVEDFLSSEAGRTILVNSSMKFLMKQDPSTIDAVQQAFKLSEGERNYLLGASRGEGIFFCNLSHVPLRVIASELEYRIATTNPQELLQAEMDRIANEQKEEDDTLRTQAIAIRNGSEYNVVLPSYYIRKEEEADNVK